MPRVCTSAFVSHRRRVHVVGVDQFNPRAQASSWGLPVRVAPRDPHRCSSVACARARARVRAPQRTRVQHPPNEKFATHKATTGKLASTSDVFDVCNCGPRRMRAHLGNVVLGEHTVDVTPSLPPLSMHSASTNSSSIFLIGGKTTNGQINK